MCEGVYLCDCVFIYVFVYIYICVCVYVCVCVCVCVCVHVYIITIIVSNAPSDWIFYTWVMQINEQFDFLFKTYADSLQIYGKYGIC